MSETQKTYGEAISTQKTEQPTLPDSNLVKMAQLQEDYKMLTEKLLVYMEKIRSLK